ncbi:T9SS type A sorting domain-containing protein [Bacteroidota bacterium]
MKKIITSVLIAICIQFNAFSQTCNPPPFTSQEQIDDFSTNYPNCTEIDGSIEIVGDDITNLYGLNQIISITKNLSIHDCKDLENLVGLENLVNIGMNLLLYRNDSLFDLTGLDNLGSYFSGGIWIEENPSLIDISNLNTITTIEGDLVITDNQSLPNLAGLDYVVHIGGRLDIYRNESLSSLNGLGNLFSVGDRLAISGNISLNDISSLEELNTVDGDFGIWENNNLVSLYGLNSLSSVTGNFAVQSNDALINFGDMPSFSSIGGNFEIYNNNSLLNFNGLNFLTSIGVHFIVSENQSLVNFVGLENLTLIGEDLSIYGNTSLNSLTGLEKSSFNSLSIWYNPLLTECDILSVCKFLDNQTGYTQIQNNGPNCNSPAEVQLICESSSISDYNALNLISIYPNPASNNITIETPTKGSLSILNINGQVLLQQEVTEPSTTIDVSTLLDGIYTLRLVGEKGVQVGKFIKQKTE